MSNQVQDDERLARQMQEAEMGQAGVQGLPQVVHGIAVGSPVGPNPGLDGVYQAQAVTIGAGSISGMPYAAAVLSDFSFEEKVVLRYRSALMCFASIDAIATIFHVATVIMALFRGNGVEEHDDQSTQGMFRNRTGLLGGYFGLLGLVFIIGPVCGIIGARRLKRVLVTVYLGFCMSKLIFDIMAAAFMPLFLWYVIFVLIQLWVTKIVYTFWKALGAIPQDRIIQLLDPSNQHNVPTRMVYW